MHCQQVQVSTHFCHKFSSNHESLVAVNRPLSSQLCVQSSTPFSKCTCCAKSSPSILDIPAIMNWNTCSGFLCIVLQFSWKFAQRVFLVPTRMSCGGFMFCLRLLPISGDRKSTRLNSSH